MGCNCALDTLVSQAAGAGNLRQCGVYLNKSRFVVLCLFLPILAILLNTESVLVALGQDKLVSAYSQQYNLVYLPGLLFKGFADCERRFLNNFGKNRIPFYTSLVGVVLHTFFCYVFVVAYKWDIVGLGIANVITGMCVYFMLLIYSR